MDHIARIVNLIATAISAKLMRTLSSQIHQVANQKNSPPSSWWQRLARPLGLAPTASWADRVAVGISAKPHPRLAKSAAAFHAAQEAHANARTRHTTAIAELDAEKQSPTGKDLVKLQAAIRGYEKALKVAARHLKSTTDKHEQIKQVLDRKPRSSKQSAWNPMVRPWPSAKQWQQAQQTAQRLVQPVAQAWQIAKQVTHAVVKPLGLTPMTWSERLGFGKPTTPNQRRLDKSERTFRAAQQTHGDAQQQHQAAVKELNDERKNPTGKDLVLLQRAILDYEKELHEAAAKLKATTTAHEKLKTEVDRQTKWQTERTKQNQWSPTQQWRKTKQAVRIAQRAWQRSRTASEKLNDARKAHATANATHQGNVARYQAARRQYRTAVNAYKTIRTGGTPAQIAKARQAVVTTYRGTRVAGAAVRASGTVVKAAGTALRTASTAATLARVAAAGRVAGPIGLAISTAIAALAASVLAVKGYVNRQLQKSEQLIEGQIRQRSQFNAQIAGAMARYEVQNIRLNMRSGAQTSATASGVVRSTMALKEAQQPTNARWENISNRLQTLANNAATNLQLILNQIDIITPAVETAVDWLEWIAGYSKKIDDNTKKEEINPGLGAIRAMNLQNALSRPHKALPPVPPVK